MSLQASQLESWQWLATPEGLDGLRLTAELFASGASELQASQTLRKRGYTGDQAPALLSQHELRGRAHRKFGDLADSLLFTPAGLEQASRFEVTALHAGRYAAANLTHVADLGCGLGAESLALLGQQIRVTAFEIDPLTASFAAHNACAAREHLQSALGIALVPAEVRCEDAESYRPTDADGVLFDPARRTSGHKNTRRVSPDDYAPSLRSVCSALKLRPGMVKLGPGLDRDLIPADLSAEWVSVDGKLVEMTLWSGELREHVQRRQATVIRHGANHVLGADHDSQDPDPGALQTFIYEPDGAVIRARQIGSLAQELNAQLLSPQIAYLTSSVHVPTPFAQAFRVREVLPVKEKHLAKALRARGIGRLEIKKRGVDVDPASLRKRLKLKGDAGATLILTRVADKHTALLVDRVDPASGTEAQLTPGVHSACD